MIDSPDVMISGHHFDDNSVFFDFNFIVRGKLPSTETPNLTPPYGISVADGEVALDRFFEVTDLIPYEFEPTDKFIVIQPFHSAPDGLVSCTVVFGSSLFRENEAYQYRSTHYAVSVGENKTSEIGQSNTKLYHLQPKDANDPPSGFVKLYRSPALIWDRMGAAMAYVLISEVRGSGVVQEINRLEELQQDHGTHDNHVVLIAGGL